jgi:lipopolysaccharide/colanic/teichoic acid biosynthesis glycosyltransferase
MSKFTKRLVDLALSTLGLILFSPLLVIVIFLVWIQDFKSPFYVSDRVGKNEKLFKMIKLRSMVIDADKTGIDSTSSNDSRITTVGHLIRNFKLDEITQLLNVFLGDMSLVGPRPNVKRETDLYTSREKLLLDEKPGITDFASIVFSDEGDILSGKDDPDIVYNQLIRPGKSELGLFYIENKSFITDLKILVNTGIAILSRRMALKLNAKVLGNLGAPKNLIELARRESDLIPSPPPGANKIVTSRNVVINDEDFEGNS